MLADEGEKRSPVRSATQRVSPHDAAWRGQFPQVTSITFSLDGQWLMASYYRSAMNRAGTDWTVWTVLWNLETGKRLRFQKPLQHHVRMRMGGGAIRFSPSSSSSPDGKRRASADIRGIIRIWDVKSGALVRTLRLDDRPTNTVLVAAIQCYSKFGEPEANRKKLTRLVNRAASRGAKIIVLPETAVTGYLSADLKKTWQAGGRPVSGGLKGVDPKDVAETVPGPSTKMFGNLAKKWGIYLTVPLLEVERKTGRYYNTSVLLGPDGRILIHYRKRDPWKWAECGWASRGDRGNPVADTHFGRLGLLICYDIHDQAKVMGRLKIDTLLYSIAWVEDKGSDWFAKKLPAIAKANKFNIIAANWTVPKAPAPKWHGYGQSCIIDAAGKVLAKVKGNLQEEIVYTELPLPALSPNKATPTTSKK